MWYSMATGSQRLSVSAKKSASARWGTIARYVWAFPTTLVGLLFVPLTLLRGGSRRVVGGVLELHAPAIALVLRRCVPIPGGAAAMTLGHVVIGRDSRTLQVTRAHERIHVRQCEMWGPIFIPAYLLATLWAVGTGGHAYSDNRFERQAYAAQRHPH